MDPILLVKSARLLRAYSPPRIMERRPGLQRPHPRPPSGHHRLQQPCGEEPHSQPQQCLQRCPRRAGHRQDPGCRR